MRLSLSKIDFQPRRSWRFRRFLTPPCVSLNVTKAKVTLQDNLVNLNILELQISNETRSHDTQALIFQICCMDGFLKITSPPQMVEFKAARLQKMYVFPGPFRQVLVHFSEKGSVVADDGYKCILSKRAMKQFNRA